MPMNKKPEPALTRVEKLRKRLKRLQSTLPDDHPIVRDVMALLRQELEREPDDE
jgi:hypothetical protein